MTYFLRRALFLTLMAASISSQAGDSRVFVGTYTGPKSKGIYAFKFDPATGKATAPELVAETPNPSFLALHPNHRWLYAVSEIDSFDGKKSGAVAAFSLNAESGKLTLLNKQPSGGTGPCHVSVDGSGKCALVANYGSGSIAVLPIRADGSLGDAGSVIQHTGSSVNPQRQQGPHAHQIVTDAANRYAFVCDLGLDKVMSYRLDPAKATLAPNSPQFVSVKPGSGPRHLAFHPNGRFAYVINEMGCTVTGFSYSPDFGTLSEIKSVTTLPADFKGASTTAEVAVHPSGKFVYGSNRGDDSIVVFAVDEKSGELTFLQRQATQGRTPRFIGIEPSGKYLLAANQGSDNVVVFRIDAATGKLEPAGETISVASPVCLLFL